MEQVLPETVDVSEYPHLQDLTFPEVDLHWVSIIVGKNVPAVHLQNEVRVPPDNDGPYGYRCPLPSSGGRTFLPIACLSWERPKMLQ